MYKYGMRLRGFSMGCQPMKGFVLREDDSFGKYYDILIYDRELAEKELYDYELDYLGGVNMITVFWVGGERDGETLKVFTNENDAINFAREFYDNHEKEFDPVCGGVGIVDDEGNEITF